jgi:hypothetical protein
MARAGQIIRLICSEDQVIRLLREITYSDGVIIHKENGDEGVLITVRKS